MKHVLAVIRTPPAMHILEIAGAMDGEHCRPTTLPIRRNVHSSIHRCPVASLETDDAWIDPIVSEELRDRRGCNLLLLALSCVVWLQVELGRLVAVRTNGCESCFIRTDINLIIARQGSQARAGTTRDRHRIEMSLEWTTFARDEVELRLIFGDAYVGDFKLT